MGLLKVRVSGSSRAGISLVEILISMSITAMILLAAVTMTLKEARMLEQQARMSFGERTVQNALRRLDKDLGYAQGWSPRAWLSQDLSSGAGPRVHVDNTLGFPNQGMLLVNPSSTWAERIAYDSFNPTTGAFRELSRGQQCGVDAAHYIGAEVLWAAHAEPIDNQASPPPNTWDGQSMEDTGAVYFRGDGTGFSYRSPIDPNGGSEFIFDGEIQWGATVNGVPLLTGHSAIYFNPVSVLTESSREVDINQDGDMLDLFDLGQLKIRSWDREQAGSTSTDTAITPPMILQERCNWGGDLDADGFDDPMFLWMPESGSLRVRLLSLVGSVERHLIARMYDTTIFVRNGSE